ncbi:hypothetical protein BDV96DRAFT_599306 [Lophiotrema nucula]|uniref:Mid2 domain-containing protein n=1 Tax=Lophiotrema nucula TaxID=690887 RepID=A0A6A5Z947_9PLEO|nr:hypothetical protein BDV96DRAFT_599306 [Lophiotrema nucula]
MSTDCFLPNGTKYDDGNHLPCNTTAVENGEYSACCSLTDLCLTNGMCRNQGDDNKGYNYYWRSGCTDHTFKDPACPPYCISNEDDRGINHLVLNCLASDNAKWACAPPEIQTAPLTGSILTDGCDEQSYAFSALPPLIYTTVTLAAVPHITTTATASSFSSVSRGSAATDTTATPAITTSPSSPSTSLQPASSSGLSSGTRVGLGVGISLGAVLLTLIGVIIILLRRRKTVRSGGRHAQDQGPYVKSELFAPNKPQVAPLHEIDSRQKPAELTASVQ